MMRGEDHTAESGLKDGDAGDGNIEGLHQSLL